MMALASTCGHINSKYLEDISSESEEEFQDNASKKSVSFISDIPVKDMENRLLMSSTASEYVTAVTSIEPCMEPPLKKQKKIDQNERCIKETPKLPKVVGRKLEFEENDEDSSGSVAKLMVWWRLKKGLYYCAGWVMEDKETSMLKLETLDGIVMAFDLVDVVYLKELSLGGSVYKVFDVLVGLVGGRLLAKSKCDSPNNLTRIVIPGTQDPIYVNMGSLYLHELNIIDFTKKGIATPVYATDIKMRWGRRLQNAYHQTSKQEYQKQKSIFQEDILRCREEVRIEVGSRKIRYVNETVAVKRKYCEIE